MEYNFSNRTITLPDSWDDITFNQYLEYIKLVVMTDKIDLNNLQDQLKVFKLVEIFANLTEEELDDLLVSEFDQLAAPLAEMIKNQVKFTNIPKHFEIDGVNYVVRDLTEIKKISNGEYISIQSLKDMGLTQTDFILKAVAILVRPGKLVIDEETKEEKWVIDKFQRRDLDNLNWRANLFKEKGKAKDLVPVLDFFLTMKD